MLGMIGEEVMSLLQWSMLAACTIGPGTVVVCKPGRQPPATPLAHLKTIKQLPGTRKSDVPKPPPTGYVSSTLCSCYTRVAL